MGNKDLLIQKVDRLEKKIIEIAAEQENRMKAIMITQSILQNHDINPDLRKIDKIPEEEAIKCFVRQFEKRVDMVLKHLSGNNIK